MNQRSSFNRKLIYVLIIGGLMIPLYLLGHPATQAAKDAPASPGGVLARLRADNGLSQSHLGEIDPTSVTVKLATLGLRGVAANILWEKAFDYKKKKDWTNLMATLRQIVKIQPNFINIWSSSVAWDVSYNISVEFDDYRQRYRWVIKGIDFLKEGIAYNSRQPRLLWDMGWMISQKIGKADESKQFRKLFKEDDDFHGNRPMKDRDNWLVGKEWFEKAVAKVEEVGLGMMGKSPLLYHSNAPMCQMNYSEYLEKDGTFGEVARRAWATAAAEWRRYANEDIPTTYRDDDGKPIIIHLGDLEKEEAEIKNLVSQLDALEPGLREKIIAEKQSKLTEAQRAAAAVPPEKRTGKEFELAAEAEMATTVTHNEVARRMSGKKREQALQLAKQIAAREQYATIIRRNRNIVNFESWRQRADVEQGHDMLEGRRLLYQGDRAYAEGDLVAARDAYAQGLASWRKVLDANKNLVEDQVIGEDLMDVITRYRRILNQLDEPFPEPFILQDVINEQQKRQGVSPPPPAEGEHQKNAG
jgi:hypothetical protein